MEKLPPSAFSRSPLFSYVHMLVRLLLLVGVVMGVFTLFASNKGIVQNHLLAQDIAEIQKNITTQKKQNQQLKLVLVSLRQNMEMVEYIARRELMLVGPNEVLFELPLSFGGDIVP